ncbi:hypothetical protein AEM42_07910 [Betaproteobacteria bacterium UKL13-2]|nr:hypothetical protein AEM42_07910 [Betaproteobacteria bacterium UKL13-2]
MSFNSTFGGDREMREFAFVAGEFAFVADMLRSIVWRIEKFSRLSFPKRGEESHPRTGLQVHQDEIPRG